MTEAAAAPRTRWGIVWLLFAAGVISAMQIGKVPPALPDLRVDLAIGMVGASWIAAIFTVLGAMIGIGAGAVSDRLGHRNIVIGSIVCVGLGSLLGAMTDSLSLLLLTRVLEGAGYIGILVSVPSFTVEASRREDYDFTLGIITPFLPFGFAGMLVLSPFLLEAHGWRGVWYFNAIVAGLFLIILVLGTRNLSNLPSARAATTKFDFSAVRRAVARPGPLVLAGAFFIYGTQWFGLNAWLPTFLMEDQGKSIGVAASLSALIIVLNGVANFLAAWLMRIGVPRWSLLIVGPAAMGLASLGIYSGDVAGEVKIGLAMAFTFLSGGVAPAILASVPVHSPSQDQIGAVTGIVMQINSLAYVVAPPLFAAVVAASGGWFASAWMQLGMGVVGVAAAFYLRHLEHTQRV